MAKTRPEFDTSLFEAVYGHRPRGRACWVFEFDKGGETVMVLTPTLTFTEARRWVRRQHPDVTTFRVGA